MSSWLLVFATVVPAFLASVVLVAWVCRGAEKLGLLDRPGFRKVHTVPIPLGGGIGIWGAVVVTFAVGTAAVFLGTEDSWWLPSIAKLHMHGMRAQASQLWLLLGGGTVLMLLGLADDRKGLDWRVRLSVEFAVAAGVVYGQGLQLTAFINLPWFTGLLSVLWIVALVNSFNMLDNMDGLSGGVAAISAAVLASMLLTNGSANGNQPQIFVAAMLLVLVGGLLGFLVHNWPPAKIFMGDAGSYFVGYWIALSTLLATYSGYQGETQHAVLAPLCVLAIPLYDMFSVIIIRLREGRSPFEGDKRHFSHRLVDLGLSKRNAVLTIYLATFSCALGAVLLPRTDWVGAIVIVVIVLCILGLIAILEYPSLKRREPNGPPQ